jgi:thiol-disulfide isomerase/thioredoxin
MKISTLVFLLVLCSLFSCESENSVSIKVSARNSEVDSLYIIESITKKIVIRASLAIDSGEQVNGEIDYPTTGSIQTKDGKVSYLTILYPSRNINITVASDSTIFTNNLGDSLLNYLWKSNNEFIAQNAEFIFTSNDPDSIVALFKDFETFRKTQIENRSENLTIVEKEVLQYQNSARIHSFLFYFGRLAMAFPPNHKYFSYIVSIDNNSKWAKTLPQNVLYKHEINYLLQNDSIVSNQDFLDYVASQTENENLSDFLKAIYLAGIVESPSYWARHEKCLNAEVLEQMIVSEKSNQYYDLIDKSSDSFFSSQKGVRAYDFEAERIDGSKLKLSDLKGKIVFIDSWASWCGPCIEHRPRILALANKYSDNPNIEILRISMDGDREDWIRYLSKMNQLDLNGELFIKNGMKEEFGERYNVKQIPKYILIDADGIIVNSNISEPSLAVEEMIEYELNKI